MGDFQCHDSIQFRVIGAPDRSKASAADSVQEPELSQRANHIRGAQILDSE
jgi:hypothetical protein